MNLSRCIYMSRCFQPRNLSPLFSISNAHSTKQAPPKTTELSEHVPEFYEEVLDVQPRVARRKPAIEPFAKNLFLSNFDPTLLEFPEVLNKDEMTAMDSRVSQIERITSDRNLSDSDILESFKSGRIFGAPATVFQGGLESNCTEKIRFMEEIGKTRVAVGKIINMHWLGMECIKKGLNKEEADALMPDLASGKYFVRILIDEKIPEMVGLSDMRTHSKRLVDGKWSICGEKLLNKGKVISTNPNNEFIIVISTIEHGLIQGFLIHPNTPGVSYRDSSVTFSDAQATLLGPDVLKVVMQHSKKKNSAPMQGGLVTQCLSHYRLATTATCIGLLKDAIAHSLHQTKGKYMGGKPIHEFPLYQNSIAEAVTVLYNMESMAYMTAGLEDGFENPDTELEALLTQLYATRETFRMLGGIQAFLAPIGLEGNIEKYIEDAKSLHFQENSTVRTLYCALLGIQYSGHAMNADINKMRNPAYYSGFILQRMWLERKQRNDNPDLALHLYNYVHLSLRNAAEALEYSVLRIRYAVEQSFALHGTGIMDEHRDLQRLTEVVTLVYGMTCSLARASRSYCIGVRGSEREMYQALMVCYLGKNSVQELVRNLVDGKYINGDEPRLDLAQAATKEMRNPAEHCLTRVFF